jgi:hypothetical protein
MKKIINGKKYNTETARKLGSICKNDGSLEYWCEELYVKRNGEYFLYGEGGAGSRYARSLDNGNWGGGEDIIPLTYDAARKWAERHLSADRYEEIFGEIPEDDSVTRLNLTLPAALVERVRRAAAEEGVNLTTYVIAKLEK